MNGIFGRGESVPSLKNPVGGRSLYFLLKPSDNRELLNSGYIDN